MAATMKKLAIVIRDDGYDRLCTPLMFALVGAKQGIEVDMLFTLWAVRVLTEEGAAAVQIHRKQGPGESAFADTLRERGFPHEIREYLRLAKQTGKVRMYGCRFAARLLGVEPAHLIPEAECIVDPLWFVSEKAVPADHCQYF